MISLGGIVEKYSNKQVVATYTYDPYGKILSATGALAEINSLRYRGYYYDAETELYYLQSRYYDPTTCRFINADSYASTGQGFVGHNMFAYCLNNPANFVDSEGKEADSYFGWGGEQIGIFLYELFTGGDHPSHQTREIERQVIQKQNEHIGNGFKSIGNGFKFIWDAYMRGLQIQQSAYLLEAQLMLNGVKSSYNILDETEVIDIGISGYHSYQAALSFKKVLAYAAAPIPTAVDEYFAVGYAFKGVYHFCKSIGEVTK